MKRLATFLLLLTTIPALSQSAKPAFRYDPQVAQDSSRKFVFDLSNPPAQIAASCEVSVAKATFDRPAQLMLTSGAPVQKKPSVHLEIANKSGREIAWVALLAQIKVKDNVYQVDSRTEEFTLRLTAVNGPQRKWLSQNAVGLDSLSVAEVTYTDGTSWRPKSSSACAYPFPGGSMRVMR
jgi:hypothetical protein